MKFENGYWKAGDIVKGIADHILARTAADISGDPNETPDTAEDVPEPSSPETKPKILGSCVLSIRFENHGDYLRWKKYFGIGRQWEFVVAYPAIMRTEYRFTDSLEAEMLAKKVVQLLEAGFNVYSAQWNLDINEEKE